MIIWDIHADKFKLLLLLCGMCVCPVAGLLAVEKRQQGTLNTTIEPCFILSTFLCGNQYYIDSEKITLLRQEACLTTADTFRIGIKRKHTYICLY